MTRPRPRGVAWWKPVSLVLLGLVLVRGGACGACAGAGRPDPDERLAGHLRGLCKVAEDGIDDPQTGVRRLMRYYGDHGPAMLEAFGATLVTIERIDDDRAHDARARLARERLQAPLIACAETWEDFGQAVEADPEASATLEHGVARLGRTLEILFGEGDGKRSVERLAPLDPRAMLRRLDR